MKIENDMIWEWDIVNDNVRGNKSWKKIYGYEAEEMTLIAELLLRKVYHKDRNDVQESIRSALYDKNIDSWKKAYRLVKKNGGKIQMVDSGYIIRDDAGNAIRMIGSLTEVTENHLLIEKVEEQKIILNEIAWEQSHLVRAPLVRLKGLLLLLEMESFQELSKRDLLLNIQVSIEELDSIICKIILKSEKIEFSTTS